MNKETISISWSKKKHTESEHACMICVRQNHNHISNMAITTGLDYSRAEDHTCWGANCTIPIFGLTLPQENMNRFPSSLGILFIGCLPPCIGGKGVWPLGLFETCLGVWTPNDSHQTSFPTLTRCRQPLTTLPDSVFLCLATKIQGRCGIYVGVVGAWTHD